MKRFGAKIYVLRDDSAFEKFPEDVTPLVIWKRLANARGRAVRGGNLRQLEVLRPGGPAPPAALAELRGDVIQERVALPSGFWLMFSHICGRIQ